MNIQALINELQALDRESLAMARRVLADATEREVLALEEKSGDVYYTRRSQISEAMLDYSFVKFDMGIISLRLNQFRVRL